MIDKATKQAYEEAQRGLVSTLLYSPGQLTEAMGLIDEDDFSDGVARTIYQAMVELERAGGKDVNYSQVLNQLVNSGKITEVGGFETLQQYFQEGAMHGVMTSISSYARTIKNIASKNRILQFSDEIQKMADEPTNSSDTVIRYGRKVLDDEMLSLSNSQDSIDVKDYFGDEKDGYLAHLREKYEIFKRTGGDPLKAAGGIPSSFNRINEATGGWLPGQLNVIGARTGIGKSFFLVDEAVVACKGGSSVLMFSLEMLKDELLDRIVCAYSMYSTGGGVTLSQLKKGQLSEKELESVENLKEEISKFKLTIDTTPSISLDHIRAKAKQLASSKTGLSMIIIDYLQLIQPPKNDRGNRERQVADVSRGLKLLSMELQVPIIVAAQLNRTTKDDADPTPTINDLRESNAIAQDASVIVLIHRDTARNADGGYDPATFIIGKNRNGQSGIRFRCQTCLNMATFLEAKEGVDDFEDDDDAPVETNTQDNEAPVDGVTTSHETLGSYDLDGDDDDEVFGTSTDGNGVDEPIAYDASAVSEEDDDDEEW